VRSVSAFLLLAGLAACTQYQPVAWDGRGSWAEARAAAAARASAGSDRRQQAAVVQRPRPIAGQVAAGSDEGRHLVLPGETLTELSYRYGVPSSTLAKANAIPAPFKIHAGQVLAIPPSRRVAAVPARRLPLAAAARPTAPTIVARELAPLQRPLLPGVIRAAEQQVEELAVVARPAMTPAEVRATREAAAKPPPPLSGEGFLWPVKGEIASGFGEKPNGVRNDGINIAAKEGTAVLAAENGVVVYAGDEIPGYGNMLLISHAGGFTTAYAHNHTLLVRVGEVVSRGQKVATVGATGNVGAPQLHFELRNGKDPVDPVAELDAGETEIASSTR
jgi:murein DD-endopeptidase MepM/ murein hydrolase activator NlpD